MNYNENTKANKIEIKSKISDVKLSYNEQLLGVALAPSNEGENAKIDFYRATNDDKLFEKQ